jgi:hypothetical protein
MSGAVFAAAGVVGTALAAGPGGGTAAPHRSVGAAEDLAPHVPIRPAPHRAAHPARPVPVRLSRAVRRTALTGSPRTVAHTLLLRRGWSETQWSCLDTLWTRESHWRTGAMNRRSGAYGIPQAMPGSKMASMGSDWRTNPLTQIRWGLWYIGASYGTPCQALAHSNRYGYY